LFKPLAKWGIVGTSIHSKSCIYHSQVPPKPHQHWLAYQTGRGSLQPSPNFKIHRVSWIWILR
jgi:hypothetical protein